MSRYNIVISAMVVVLLSFQYLLMSIQFNEIAILIAGENPYLNVFGTINNIVLFCYPFFVFIFLILSIHYMLEIFEIKTVSIIDIFVSVGLSFTPLDLGMIFYNISLIFYNGGMPNTIEKIQNMHFFLNLQINDFRVINQICWLAMYYLIFLHLYFKYKISLLKSLATCIIPTLLFLLFSLLISSIN